MTVKATAQITLSSVIDVKATYRYYLLQSSTLTKPAKPSTFPPASTWGDVEPSYVDGSTNSLYFVDCTVFCDDTFNYSEVSLSSAYEAAKAAYNKAVNAQNGVNNLTTRVTNAELEIDKQAGEISLRVTRNEVVLSPKITGNQTQLVQISNALANSIENIKIYGKTTQDGTPTPDTPIDLVSVDTSKNLFGGEILADKLVSEASATKDAEVGTVTYSARLVNDKIIFEVPDQSKRYTFIAYGMNIDNKTVVNLKWSYADGSAEAMKFNTTGALSYLVSTSSADKQVIGIKGSYNDGTVTLYYDQCGVFEGVLTEAYFEPYTGSSVSVTVTGKNLFDDIGWFVNNDFTKQSDGSWLGKPVNKICWTNIEKTEGAVYMTVVSHAEKSTNSPTYMYAKYTDGTNSGILDIAKTNSFVPLTVSTDPNKTVDYIQWTYGGAGVYYIKGFMISFVDGEYTPYPYTVPQTIAASTPNGLAGVPKPREVGDGFFYTPDYVDAEGNAWISDYVDVAKGVRVQRFKTFTVTQATDIRDVINGFGQFYINLPADRKLGSYCLCSHYNIPIDYDSTLYTNPTYTGVLYKRISNNPGLLFVSHEGITTLDEYNAWLAENQPVFLYELATPIETPLSAKERAAFANISNDPGTVVISSEAALEVEVSGMASTSSVSTAQETANRAQDSANDAIDSIARAESTIKQLADSIKQLVRNGADDKGSMVFHEEDGLWYFDISGLQSTVSNTANDVTGLQESAGKTNAALEILNKTAEDLASQVEYIRSYTDENDQPCLELGEGDSVFKVRITNTDIQFAEGTDVPARLNRKMLVIEKAMVKQELQFGDDELVDGVWIWQCRSNGNLGLSWKEVVR